MRKIRKLVLAAILLVVSVLALTVSGGFYPVMLDGSATLTVRFLVRDRSGMPIPQARITVQSDGEFDLAHKPLFTLLTDRHGVAQRVCPETRCSRTHGPFWRTSTVRCSTPRWLFQTTAIGYHTTTWADLFKPRTMRRQIMISNVEFVLEVTIILDLVGADE